MITINLKPSSGKEKVDKSQLLDENDIPVLIGVAGLVVFVLILAHSGLLTLNMQLLRKHQALSAQWGGMVPIKADVDKVVSELRGLQAKAKAMEVLLPSERISWAQKLNILSDDLPRGVWLRKIALTDDMLYIDGSAISKEKKEMINVHSLTAALKDDASFLNHLTDLELESIQRRWVQNTEVADFLITAKTQRGMNAGDTE